MLLQINDTKAKSITVVKVMMLEYEEASDTIKIWDMCDNIAMVKAKSAYDASSCVRSLFSNERATLNDAEIDWDHADNE